MGASRPGRVLLLDGAARGDAVTVGTDRGWAARFPVVMGRFRAVAPLLPGANVVTAGEDRFAVEAGDPAVPPYRAVVALGRDEPAVHPDFGSDPSRSHAGEDGGDAIATRFATALDLLQAVLAQLLVEAGHPRRTFALARAPGGRVAVAFHRLPETAEELRHADPLTYWKRVRGSLADATATTPYVALMGWSRYTPPSAEHPRGRVLGHCARGGAGLGLFGSASVHSWPRDLADVPRAFTDTTRCGPDRYDDSAFRGTSWASAATTIGAILHEIGHTLGLGHCKQQHCLMLRGGDHLNRHLVAAEPGPRLRLCPGCAAHLAAHPLLGGAVTAAP